MSDNIPYETIKNLLVGDYGSENDLAVVLSFLKKATSVIRQLYWDQRIKNEQHNLNEQKNNAVN